MGVADEQAPPSLLLPFAAGQLARRWIGEWVARNKRLVGLVSIAARSCSWSMSRSARA
jgi:predicted Na+-dependent transporter